MNWSGRKIEDWEESWNQGWSWKRVGIGVGNGVGVELESGLEGNIFLLFFLL